jgi:hypothetical protein
MTRANIYSTDDISRVEGLTGLVYAGNLICDEWGAVPIFLKPASRDEHLAKILKVNGRGSFPAANQGGADE